MEKAFPLLPSLGHLAGQSADKPICEIYNLGSETSQIKAVDSRLDSKAASRDSEDKALNARIDREISDRDKDTAAQTKLAGQTGGGGRRTLWPRRWSGTNLCRSALASFT